MKVNLGCGKLKREGWLNVDYEPRTKPDVVSDMLTFVQGCADDSLDAVLMEHSLEHVSWPDAQKILAALCRKLKPGAQLTVEVPDLLKCFRLLQKQPGRTLFIANVYGGHAIKGAVEHRWGYTRAFLLEALQQAGFSKVEDSEKWGHPRWGQRRDLRLVARR